MHFTEGQDVKKGQPLFTLDPAAVPGGAVAGARRCWRATPRTAKNAERQQARYEDLFKRGLIPRDQYETQRASSDVARRRRSAADRAAVENAQAESRSTRDITAPISGRTGALGVHAGDLVRANDTTPLVVINQVSPIYVTFSVPGRYLGDIRRYQAQTAARRSTARRPGLGARQGAQAPAPPAARAPAAQVAPGQGATAPVSAIR